jgi:hypothetical protein
MTTDNTLLKVAGISMVVCRRYLAAYSHKKSPQRFTQAQLMTCLILRAYLKQTYRGIAEVLEVAPTLCQKLGLQRVPKYSTLKKFEKRVANPALLDALLAEVLALVLQAGDRQDAAMDSTGLSPSPASVYYRGRAGKASRHFVKLAVVVTVGAMLAVAMRVSFGPSHDLRDAPWLLDAASRRLRPGTLYADKGYDAEWIHRFCRAHWGVRSVIPVVFRSADGRIATPYRHTLHPVPKDYGRRWTVESFMSGLKRSTGGSLTARAPQSLLTEAALRVLAYAIRR